MDRNKFYDSLRSYNDDSLIHSGISALYGAIRINSKPIAHSDMNTTDVNDAAEEAENTGIYSNEEQEIKYNNAKDNNMYDKSFVNVVKNKDNLNKDTCLEEYKKYLSDPSKYCEGRE